MRRIGPWALGHLEALVGVGVVLVAVVLAAVAVDLRHDQSARADRARTDATALELRRYTYARDIKDWHDRLRGCGRTKTDRTSIARALRAQSTYLTLVLDAASVKQDVKMAARATQRVFDASSTDLESRTGAALICSEVYRKPPAPVGVTELP